MWVLTRMQLGPWERRTGFKGKGIPRKGIPICGPGAVKFEDEWLQMHPVSHESRQSICAPLLSGRFRSSWLGGESTPIAAPTEEAQQRRQEHTFPPTSFVLELGEHSSANRKHFWGFQVCQAWWQSSSWSQKFSSLAHNSDLFIKSWSRLLNSWYSGKSC